MKKRLLLFLLLFSLAVPLAVSQDNSKAVYKNPSASVPDRVRSLLRKMPIAEKVAQLESGWTLPAFGALRLPRPVDGDHINEVMAKKVAGNGDSSGYLIITCPKCLRPNKIEA